MSWDLPKNPFVGLRPFETEEALLFFGRHEQTRQLLQQLYKTRFLAVVGSSGCGKSSLIRAGLIPKLLGGFLVEERDIWLVTKMKPGEAPLLHLCEAILAATDQCEERAVENNLLGAIQDKGITGLLEFLAPHLQNHDANLLILVDQFEEIFRFSRTHQQREEAAQFVAMMLGLAEQGQLPIYVTMTMRSDYLGDCDAFLGLPEAMNRSQFLVPRLTREQRREAIEGPVRLYQGKITNRLTDRLLNETGEARDDLPIMQHALMRTWDHARKNGIADGTLELEDYRAIGTVNSALSQHADEALREMDRNARTLTKQLFQALTETDHSNRRIRRPAKLSEIQSITGAQREEVWPIIQKFRSESRSFLVVSSDNLGDDPLIDISHESLIRQWNELNDWVDEEVESAEIYRRLAEGAVLYNSGRAGLWRDPELQLGLEWRTTQQPNEAWAKRYHPEFKTALDFLEESRSTWEAEETEKEEDRKREIRRLRTIVITVSSALVLLIIATGIAIWSLRIANRAEDNAIAQLKKAEAARLDLIEEQKTSTNNLSMAIIAEKEARARQYLAQANEIYSSDPILGMRLALEGLALRPGEEDILNDIRTWISWGRIANIYTDTVSLETDPNNSALFVANVDEGSSAIWHANGLEPLAQLADRLEKVFFSNDGTRFLVDYTNAPPELRQTADGSVIATLISNDQSLDTHNITNVFFSPEAVSTSFVVNYEDRAEIRNSSSDNLLINLDGDVADVTFSRNETFFILDYSDREVFDELRKTSDGSLIETFHDEVFDVKFSPDETLVFVDYLDSDDYDELRLTADGGVLITGISNIFFNSDWSRFVVNNLTGQGKAVLGHITDGKPLTETLTAEVSNVMFSPKESFVVIDYSDSEEPDVIGQITDGHLLTETLTAEVSNVMFSPNESLFVIDYSDSDARDELGQITNGTLITPFITTLSGEVEQVTFIPESEFFYVEYSESPGELRLMGEGEVQAVDISNIYFSPDQSLLFLDYQDEGIPDELLRADDGRVLASDISDVTFGPNDLLYAVNFREPEVSNELRRSEREAENDRVLAVDFTKVTISPQANYFIVQYETPEKKAEIHAADGEFLGEIATAEISAVTFSSDELVFIVYYVDGSAEVFQTSNGLSVANFTDEVSGFEFFSDAGKNLLFTLVGRQEHRLPFDGQAGETVNIYVTNNNYQTDRGIYLELYSPDVGYIYSDSRVGEVQTHNFLLPESGRYYVVFYGENPDTYTLSINVVAADAADQAEIVETRPVKAFVVHYANDRADIVSLPDGDRLTTLEGVEKVFFAPDPESSLFVVEYKNGQYEVHQTLTGRAVALSGAVSRVTSDQEPIRFTPDEEATAFIVQYENGTAELRRTVDGELITRLASEASNDDAVILSQPDGANYFGLRYMGDETKTKIHDGVSGVELNPKDNLQGDAYELLCAPHEDANTCVVVYTGSEVGEVRQASDGELLMPLTDKTINVAFGPPDGARIFIVNYVKENSEIRWIDDSSRVVSLSGTTSEVIFSPNNDANMVIISYDGQQSEVRSTEDGSILTLLSGEVSEIIFCPDENSTSFIVTFTGEEPSEVVQLANDMPLQPLSGKVKEIIFSPDPAAAYFIVTYPAKPSEVRRSSDGELLAVLNGENVGLLSSSASPDDSVEQEELPAPILIPEADVEFSLSAEAALFVVKYAGGQTEVWRTENREVVSSFAEDDDNVVKVLFSSEPAAAVFAVIYQSGAHEFHRISDGEVVDLMHANGEIVFSEGENPSLFAISTDLAHPIISRMSDAAVIVTSTLTNTIEQILVDSPANASVFLVDYVGAAGELYNLADRELITTLSAEIDNVSFLTELPGVFIVEYQELGYPAEMRQSINGEVLFEFAQRDIERITFSFDKDVFVFYYADGSAEVYQISEQKRLAKFTDRVKNVFFDIESAQAGIQPIRASQIEGQITDKFGDAWIFKGQAGDRVTINMSGDFDTLLELRDSRGSILISDSYYRDYNSSQIRDYQLPSTGTYTIIANNRYGDFGSYSLSVDGISLFAFDETNVSEVKPAAVFVVQYADGRAEVWDIKEKRGVLSTFSNFSSLTFSPDPDRSVVVAEFSGLLEIYRSSDGKRLANKVTDIFYSPDPEKTYFIVAKANSAGQIFYTATGELLETLNGEVVDLKFSAEKTGIYFVVKYPGDRNEVWLLQDQSPHLVTDLRSNVTEDFIFDESNLRLVVRYEDGNVYMLDLRMPEALRDVPDEDLKQMVCSYPFPPGTFDRAELEAELRVYLGEDKQPAACP